MKYVLLVKKLEMIKEKYVTADTIKDYCINLDLGYYVAIRYLTANKYLITILRGIFYKPSLTERKIGTIEVNHLDALAEALKIKGIDNWYLGLETALTLNNATHEYFSTATIINDTLFRKNPVRVMGNKIKFIKVKKAIATLGIKKSGNIKYADIEKTVLDMIYLSKYNSINNKEIKNRISPILHHCSRKKLKEYSKAYNKVVEGFIESL